jgi:prepilin-type N-terminal cleavage/methylation domain-containing protein
MNRASLRSISRATRTRGMTLVELMVAVALGSMLVATAGSIWLFGSRSFAAMSNYVDLDSKSRNGIDRMLRELRQATRVTAIQKSDTTKLLTVTNAIAETATTYIWQATPRTLVARKTGQPDQVYLTECDRWDFELFQRTPQRGQTYVFYAATNAAGSYDLSLCKLINMSWKCSRTILGSKVNTESVQTAQVVLRNKQ